LQDCGHDIHPPLAAAYAAYICRLPANPQSMSNVSGCLYALQFLIYSTFILVV